MGHKHCLSGMHLVAKVFQTMHQNSEIAQEGSKKADMDHGPPDFFRACFPAKICQGPC